MPNSNEQLHPESFEEIHVSLKNFWARDPVITLVEKRTKKMAYAFVTRATGSAHNIRVSIDRDIVLVGEDELWNRFRHSENPTYAVPFEERHVVLVKQDHPYYRTLRARQVDSIS